MTGFHIGRTERRLSTMSTTTAYAWYTSWLPAIGMDSVKGVLQKIGLELEKALTAIGDKSGIH